MSKISQKNKKLKAEGKMSDDTAVESQKTSIANYGKCCSCKYYPKHISGKAMLCKKLNAYVARKAEHPECYVQK